MSFDTQYLENLEEEILQLNNVITYKWLIRTYKVSSNTAKQMLHEFVEKRKADGVNISITYLVAGQKRKEDGMVHEVCLVPSTQLESAKASFSKITSIHIYAVHKGPLQDPGVLYGADVAANLNNTEITKKRCMIVCNAAYLKDLHDSEEDDNETMLVDEQHTGKKDVCLPAKTTSGTAVNGLKRKVAQKSGVLSNMFQNMAKNSKMNVKRLEPAVQKDGVLPTKTSGLGESQIARSQDPTKSDVKTGDVHVTKTESENKPFTRRKAQPTKKQKRQPDKMESQSCPRKRRRIFQISDSSSSSSSEEEAESPIPDSPERLMDVEDDDSEDPLPPPTSRLTIDKSTRHHQKIIEETVQDDDGYLVTQKKVIVVSASEDSDNENEDPVSHTNEVKSVVKDTKVPVQPPKSKQATLMNFFKRK